MIFTTSSFLSPQSHCFRTIHQQILSSLRVDHDPSLIPSTFVQEAFVSTALSYSQRRPLRSALKVFCHPQPQCRGGLNRSLKPNPMSNELISSTYKLGQTIAFELEERNTQAESREQSAEEEHASRLFEAFRPVRNIFLTYCFLIISALITKQGAEGVFFSGWPLNEDDCLSAGLGTKCDPFCVFCDKKDVCMQCALKPYSKEASFDPLCPLRIPGCRFVNSKLFFFVRDPRPKSQDILQERKGPCTPEPFW